MPMPTLTVNNMSGHSKATRENKSSYLSSFVRWLQLKKYQYEVTFSLYMLTPTEKFVFSMRRPPFGDRRLPRFFPLFLAMG